MISIVMPVYNSIPYLKDSIEDILAQSYTDIELICVDDGSTDQSKDVLYYFASVDERVKVLEQNHKGAGEARNCGMDSAVGEYLIFLDADDRYRKDMLETLVRKAKESDADITLCDGIIFDNLSGILLDNSWILRVDQMPSLCYSPEECSDHLFEMTSGMPWNKLYKSCFVRQYGIRYKNSSFWNDTFFSYLLLALADIIAVVPEKLVAYRTGNSGSITKSSKLETAPDEGLRLLEEIQISLRSYGIYDIYLKTFSRFVMEKYLQIINRINEDNYQLIFPYISPDYLDGFGVGTLNENEFAQKEHYEAYMCLKDKGRDAFLCRLLGIAARLHEWYYMEKYKRERIFLERQENAYFYDLPNIDKGCKVILYGAGERGRKLREKIIRLSAFSIIAWADAGKSNKLSNDERIISVDEIKNYEYDYIIVAVDSPHVMKEIKTNLMNAGFPQEKIIW